MQSEPRTDPVDLKTSDTEEGEFTSLNVDPEFPQDDIEAVMSKTRFLMLGVQYNKYADVYFKTPIEENPDDWDPRSYKELKMSTGQWDDLGRPMTITVTVEPGDKLNTDES